MSLPQHLRDKEIPPQDRGFLHTIYKTEDLPEEVIEAYWYFRTVRTRLCDDRRDTTFWCDVAGMAGGVPFPTPPGPQTLSVVGEPVIIEWRKKKVEAVLREKLKDSAIVEFDNTRREIPWERVFMPELAEV